MEVRVAETTIIFKNIQIMALIALIGVVQVILKAIVTIWKINRTVRGTSNNGGQGERSFNFKDVAFTTIIMKNNFANDLWILDSGASCHYCRSVEGLTDIKEVDESIKIGNSDSMKSIKIGNLKCDVTQIDGEKFTVTLNDVKYVPSLCVNKFSFNK
jgi:hypothetical protein